MDELYNSPVEQWTEFMVSKWLESIGVKEQYIKKLQEEEVNGQVLLELTEDFLKKETGMKSGPALLIIKKRKELIDTVHKIRKRDKQACHKTPEIKAQGAESIKDHPIASHPQKEEIKEDCVPVLTTKRDSKPRPFGKKGSDYTYVKHNVLQPESGVIDLITPCHEYKAFTIAATLDRPRLQAKFAKEVFKFATGCINIRSNGTIYFGVMDSRENTGYVHGEIVGVPIKERDMYVDALDHIEKSFSNSELVRQCIRPPELIRVIEQNSKEEHYVVEVDVVPSFSLVRNTIFSVRLPNFNEKCNKIEFEKAVTYCRVGSKTQPVADLNEFNQGVFTRDAHREEAEKGHRFTGPDLCQDLGRKLIMLVTSGKKTMDKEKWYILVTNKFKKEALSSIDFLLNMNIFCVFDFDPDSNVTGLCHEYVKHHAANLHFMHNYKIPSGKSIREFESHLHLFEQTSWIFCNGRNDFKGNETPCDEKTWSKTKRTFLKDCVSLICKDILPKGTFLVLFLLTSPVETPLLSTFYEFFTDMNGHEDIICISETEENFQKWQAFALQSCDMETVDKSSVVGVKMNHVNATLQEVQTATTTKLLPVSSSVKCILEKRDEERMPSLEILSTNQCDETDNDTIESNKKDVERQFYHGGKVTWMNLWLAEKKFVEEVIQRDAYYEVTKLLSDSLEWSVSQRPISCINIYHQPGSGGSTVARQVLWNNRRKLRCAVVSPSHSVDIVSKHAVELREHKEKDPRKCLPVLLLVEDCDKEYLEDLKNELEGAVYTKEIAHGTPCFILLSCRRSNEPEKMCKDSPLQNVSVTHKLSEEEKRHFAGKRKQLEEKFQPEFILTFVLMSEEFENESITKYVEHFVTNLLQGIDHASVVTRLIHYVALLNTYVQNSFISQSHCEALLALPMHMSFQNRFRKQTFEFSLNEQAKLVFIHLRDERTHIESIRIIHPLVAEKILHQLLGDKPQSELALDLLNNDVLFEHRFGRDDYMKFLRALFMRRYRISKGDKSDSFFSPLIEHIREKEQVEKAIELLKEAYKRFSKDPFFAQQLARLNYRHERFEEAEHWADIAVTKLPNNSYILDTKGQVYRRWFKAKCKSMEKIDKTAENMADAIETAFKAIDCFQACQKAAAADMETMNLSGFFGEVEVEESLLKLITSLPMFSNETNGCSKCLKYLLTDYIPKEIEKPWQKFHDELKNLQASMHESLEWISEDLSYFQRDLNVDEEETLKRPELTVIHPKRWLVKKAVVYGKYFSEGSLSIVPAQWQSNPDGLSPLTKRMIIYRLGGGNITTIFSILDQKDKNQVKTFEEIISLYPRNPLNERMDHVDLVNYCMSHIALSAVAPHSQKLAAFSDLQRLVRLSRPQDKPRCHTSALFLCMLLFWPEEHDSDCEKEKKYEEVLSAVEFLKQRYWAKIKDIPSRRRRIYTQFFLGNGVQYEKFVHKAKIEISNKLPLSEKRQKWIQGELLKMPEIAKMLKRVTGWTEDGTVYLEGPKTRFPIPALHEHSVPYGNENVTFNLGFTMRGPVAYNIEKIKGH